MARTEVLTRRAERARRTAEQCGCRVVEETSLATEDGPQPVLVVVCPDAASMTALLDRRSLEDAGDPHVRDLALQLSAPFGDLPPDVRARAIGEAIQQFVLTRVRFVPETRETFQRSLYTLRRGAGDCDDHSALSRALGVAAGLRARLQYYGKPSSPRHVVTAYHHHGAWHPAETTLGALYGEDPFRAAKRLGAHREDLGTRRGW